VVKTKDGKPNPALAQMPAALILKHLAEALRLLAVSSLNFERRRGAIHGAVFLGPAALPRCARNDIVAAS
jgi:hypothetical protein